MGWCHGVGVGSRKWLTCFPVSQLPLGRQCVEHYRLLHRYCVFSHDEMICRMAAKAGALDVVVASTVQKDMATMIEDERALRETVRKLVRLWDPSVVLCCGVLLSGVPGGYG